MPDLEFHKSCYTARSSGYKYRTLSTNTGDRKRRDSREDNSFERKFRELSSAILIRVNKQVNRTNKARKSILEKFENLEAKINSMVEIQKTVTELNDNLQDVSLVLLDMMDKVGRIEMINSRDMFTQQSHISTFMSQEPIAEEKEDRDSIVTHI